MCGHHFIIKSDPTASPISGFSVHSKIKASTKEEADRIINHLKLTFVAERPPPPHMAYQELLMAAEVRGGAGTKATARDGAGNTLSLSHIIRVDKIAAQSFMRGITKMICCVD